MLSKSLYIIVVWILAQKHCLLKEKHTGVGNMSSIAQLVYAYSTKTMLCYEQGRRLSGLESAL